MNEGDNTTSSIYNTPPLESTATEQTSSGGGGGQQIIAIQNPGDDNHSMVASEALPSPPDPYFVATEFARRAGVDTAFYTEEYLVDRRRQVDAFLGGASMDGVQPTQVNQYAQRYLYEEYGSISNTYFRQFQRASQSMKIREAEHTVEMYLQTQVPINGTLPGIYVIANRYPNEFCVNLLRLEGLIESIPRDDMNTVNQIIEMTVKAENWEIVKRTLANLRAERQRILTDQANTVEVRIGRLGRFYQRVRRRIQRMNENTRREIASIRQFARETD